jgi:TRAP-type C4-dicarboxylate transport system permease large subunit
VLPFLLALFLAVLLITYVPALTLGPVEWFFPPAADAPPPVRL